MKNINLAPPSPKSVKGERRNKPFIFVSLFLLMLFSFVCFFNFIPLGKQWQDKFVARIGSLLNTERPDKTKKISFGKKYSEVKKTFELKSKEQVTFGNIDTGEMEKEDPISGGKNKEPAGIEIKENRALKKADNEIITGRIEEKPMPAKSDKSDKKVISAEIEKEPVLVKAERKQEGGDAEKIKQMERSEKNVSDYYIQVCSCVIKENADKTFRRLGDEGYSPIMKEIVRHVKMHNIYTDDFKKKSEAFKLLDRLKSDGFDSVLLPSSDGRYKLRITSCYYMESAEKVIRSLSRSGYKAIIRKEFIPTKMYSVLLGNFASLREAEAVSQKLIKNGYPPPILKRNIQI